MSGAYQNNTQLIPGLLGIVFVFYLGLVRLGLFLTMSTFLATFFCTDFWFVAVMPTTMARRP